MKTNTSELYCSEEIGRLLVDAGFDWETNKIYERNIMAGRYENIPMPTLQMALHWLRTEKKIYIYAQLERNFMLEPAIRYLITIVAFDEKDEITYYDPTTLNNHNDGYGTPEEGLFEALKYVLEKIVWL